MTATAWSKVRIAEKVKIESGDPNVCIGRIAAAGPLPL